MDTSPAASSISFRNEMSLRANRRHTPPRRFTPIFCRRDGGCRILSAHFSAASPRSNDATPPGNVAQRAAARTTFDICANGIDSFRSPPRNCRMPGFRRAFPGAALPLNRARSRSLHFPSPVPPLPARSLAPSRVFDSGVVQAFRPARHGGPEGPHYAGNKKLSNASRRAGARGALARESARWRSAARRPWNRGTSLGADSARGRAMSVSLPRGASSRQLFESDPPDRCEGGARDLVDEVERLASSRAGDEADDRRAAHPHVAMPAQARIRWRAVAAGAAAGPISAPQMASVVAQFAEWFRRASVPMRVQQPRREVAAKPRATARCRPLWLPDVDPRSTGRQTPSPHRPTSCPCAAA